MRREWSGWIKTRQWSEFERLAKTEPSAALADVVGELERGFDERSDRRALRKVLYLLERSGYRPTPLDHADEPKPQSSATPFEAARMVSADARGDAVITYGFESMGRVRWLVAHVNGRYGLTDAREEETSRDTAEARVAALASASTAPFEQAEVPPDFAKSRLAEATRLTAGALPSVIASWRVRLEAVPPMDHPAEPLPREAADAETLRKTSIADDATMLWRLELGSAAPLLKVLQEIHAAGLDPEPRRQRVEEAASAHRSSIFTEPTVRDHVQRLFDLAYIRHLRGRSGVGLLLSAADDLRANGAESEVAKGLMDKTIVLLVETIRSGREGSGA